MKERIKWAIKIFLVSILLSCILPIHVNAKSLTRSKPNYMFSKYLRKGGVAFGGSDMYKLCQMAVGKDKWIEGIDRKQFFSSQMESTPGWKYAWGKIKEEADEYIATNKERLYNAKGPEKGKVFSELYSRSILLGINLLHDMNVCATIHLLTAESGSERIEKEMKQTLDGKIICRGNGNETQDYKACTGLISVYDMGGFVEQVNNQYSQFDHASKGIDDQAKIMADPMNAVNSMEAQQRSIARMKKYANKQRDISTLKAAALWTSMESIPVSKDAREYFNAVYGEDNNRSSFGYDRFKEYVVEIQKTLQETYEGQTSYTTKNKLKGLFKVVDIGKLLLNTFVSSAYANDAAALAASGSKELEKASAGIRCNYGCDVAEVQRNNPRGRSHDADEVKDLLSKINVEGKGKGKGKVDSGTIDSLANAFEGLVSTGEFYDIAYSSITLFPNGVARQMAKRAMFESGSQALGQALKAKLYGQRADMLGKTIKDANNYDAFEDVSIADEELLSRCQMMPTLPECAQGYDTGSNGFGIGDINITGNGQNGTVGPAAGEEIALNKVDVAGEQGAMSDGTPSDDLGVGGYEDPNDNKHYDFVGDSPGVASVKSDFGSGGGGGGSGGGSGGGGAPPAAKSKKSSGGGQQSARAPSSKSVPFTAAVSSLRYNTGNGVRGKGKKGPRVNPFKSFGKNPARGLAGSVLNIANGRSGISRRGRDIFSSISRRYSIILKNKRLEEYKLVD